MTFRTTEWKINEFKNFKKTYNCITFYVIASTDGSLKHGPIMLFEEVVPEALLVHTVHQVLELWGVGPGF